MKYRKSLPVCSCPQMHGKRILKLLQKIFSWLPLATVIDQKVLVLHGGISDSTDLSVLARVDRHNVRKDHMSVINRPHFHFVSFLVRQVLRQSMFFFPVCLSTEASKEETPEFSWDVHRLRHGLRLVQQQGLPAPGLPHVSQTFGNTKHLSEPLAAGFLWPAQSERRGRSGEPREESIRQRRGQQIRKWGGPVRILWLYQQWQQQGRVEAGEDEYAAGMFTITHFYPTNSLGGRLTDPTLFVFFYDSHSWA